MCPREKPIKTLAKIVRRGRDSNPPVASNWALLNERAIASKSGAKATESAQDRARKSCSGAVKRTMLSSLLRQPAGNDEIRQLRDLSTKSPWEEVMTSTARPPLSAAVLRLGSSSQGPQFVPTSPNRRRSRSQLDPSTKPRVARESCPLPINAGRALWHRRSTFAQR